MHHDTVDKLQHKNAMHELEWDLKNRFDFSDILANALIARIELLLEESGSNDLGSGQIPYWGVKSNEPSGKTLNEMEKGRVIF